MSNARDVPWLWQGRTNTVDRPLRVKCFWAKREGITADSGFIDANMIDDIEDAVLDTSEGAWVHD